MNLPLLTNRSFILSLAACVLVNALLISCQPTSPPLTPTQQSIRAELDTIDPVRDPLVTRTRIIDVHTHTFNSRYLPLRGVLHGKRDAFPPLSWLLSDNCATALAQAIAEKTELSSSATQSPKSRTLATTKIRSDFQTGPLCNVFLNLLDKAVRNGAWNPKYTSTEQLARIDEVAVAMNPAEVIAVTTAARMMGMEEAVESSEKNGAKIAIVRFFWMLTQNDADMPRIFREMHGPRNGPRITMVSHMMDLAPVYDQKPDGTDLIDFEREQIPRMQRFSKNSDGRLSYFVAYNPYRDSWQGGEPGDALRIVKEAVTRHGATGVKIYPPSGYRAAGNAIEKRPTTFFTDAPGKQWDARYGQLDPAAPSQDLDRKIESLLLWCIKNDIPVFTHCGHGEFEARKGYGILHANPKWWKAFLESHPAPGGGPCKLRLCLGHAGGEEFWTGVGDHQDWGAEVMELCTNYPNVYCEVSTGAFLSDPSMRARFVDHVGQAFRRSATSPYPLSKKLLYGTDWYLPDPDGPANILTATQRAFLHPILKPHFADYFYRNTLRFLNDGNSR